MLSVSVTDPYDNDNICIVYASISRCYKGLHYRQFRHQRSEPGSWLVINVPTDHQYFSTPVLQVKRKISNQSENDDF